MKVETESHSVEGKAVEGQLLLTELNGVCAGVFELSGSVAAGKPSALASVLNGGVQGVMVAGSTVLLRLTNGIVPPDSKLVKW